MTPDWRSDAACRDMHPGLFYPQERGQAAHHALREIRPICAACPVQDACYLHALHHELFGLWAGTSEKQRKDERRRLGIRVASPDSALVHALIDRSETRDAVRQRLRRASARGDTATKRCAWCGGYFAPPQTNIVTCSPACSAAHAAREKRRRSAEQRRAS